MGTCVIGLLTGAQDGPYALGLATSLSVRGVNMEVIGGDAEDRPEFHRDSNLTFLNLRGQKQLNTGFITKVQGTLLYYFGLFRYAVRSKADVFHILWNNRFEYFDRTVLTLFYKMCGKKIVLTAHNINGRRRDGNDSMMNRLTLRIQYHLVDHVCVHTEKMKAELLSDFFVPERAVTIIVLPINTAFPETEITSSQARQRLGIEQDVKTILFFGRIGPYKGLEYLVKAFQGLPAGGRYQLLIAGELKKGAEAYLKQIEETIEREIKDGRIIWRIQFIPD